MLQTKTLDYAKEITTALLGVDRLYRSESGDEDGLVVVDMSYGEYQPERFSGYTEARSRWQDLRSQAAGLPEADRRLYYDQLCQSTLALLQWREQGLSFTDQLSNFLHVPAEPASQEQLDSIKSEMRTLLNRMGYPGDLRQQCEAWEARNRVAPEDVPGVLSEMLNIAWDRTEERLHIPAPRSDGMQVVPVSGVAFNARCNYLERKIELNTDPILTRPGLKHLTVHEGYPGHYVQFKLRETWYREGTAPADNLLSIVNSASSSTFEGIADNGMTLIEWVETDDDRLQNLLGRYRSGIGTIAAWKLHALALPEDQVAGWLRQQTLVGGEGWVTGRMRFISAPARAALIWSYWWGERVVTPAYQRVPADLRSEFLRYLYGRMHSNQTVEMFRSG